MKARVKTIALIALCVAVVVLLLWQRSQITKLHQHNAELRAQLADAQRKPPAEQPKPTTATSPNPELLRLRAEVAELRRQKVKLANTKPNTRTENKANSGGADELPFDIRVQQNTWGTMRLVLALRSIAGDRQDTGVGGRFPVVDKDGQLQAEIRREWEKYLKQDDTTAAIDLATVWRDVELVITDAADIRTVDPNTIVARTVAMKMPNGKWTRVYFLADGSGHRRVHNTPDELWQATPP
jgi:hypothetical protein